MRVLLLTNPQAGPAGSACPPERFLTPMRAWGWDVQTRPVLPDDDFLGRAAGEFAAVVVAGGDGTLHRVANALAGSTIPLGILPCGTANDLARTLGLPLDPDAALQALRDAESRPIDLGLLNGHYFLNVAALGLSAEVSAGVSDAQKRRMGHRAYAWNAFLRLRNPRRLLIHLSSAHHDETLEVAQLSVGNGRSFGGGWPLARDARLTDHLLDVVVMEPLGPLALLARLFFRRGALAERIASRTYRLSACRIDLAGPAAHAAVPREGLAVNLDGEPLTLFPPLEFRVVPEALFVLMPKPKPASLGETGSRDVQTA